MPLQVTTELPDEDQPQLNNGVEDEIGVDRETQTTDYGSVRVHYRETGASSWIDWGVVPYDRLDPVIAGLEDGEEYEVRLRSETEHHIGEWTTPVAITTKFPGATQLQTTGATQTSVDLEFQDNADNEDGVYLERRELFRTGWGEWRRLKDLGPNSGTGTVTATDATAQPGTTYEYRVIPYTEHSTATSDSVETTTQDDGVRADRVPATGWHVVVEDDAGNQYSPTVVGSPSFNPTLNGLPTVEIPIADGERWTDTQFDEAPMRVYLDGDRLPIDTLVAVDRSESQATLRGRGGSALRERAERSYQSEAVHTANEDLITSVGYAVDVDVPATETLTDQVLQSADTTSEFTNRLLTSITSTTPVDITNGKAKLLDSGAVIEGENWDRASGMTTVGGPDWSGNATTDGDGDTAAFLDSGEYAEWDFSIGYDIPDGEVGLWIREDDQGSSTPTIQWSIDGTVVYEQSRAVGLKWFDLLEAADTTIGGLSAGSHTLRAEVTSSGSANYLVDVVAPLDNRYSYTFDNSTESGSDGGRYLQGPEAVPDQFDLVFEDAATAYSVTDGAVASTWSSTGGNQQLAVSKDLGTTWLTAANTTSLDQSFAERGGTLRFRARLSRDGSRSNQTPLSGYRAQFIDSYQLKADLDDVATLVNRSYDGRVSEILTDNSEFGDLTWEVRWDDGYKVIVTRPGLRTSSEAATLTDYTVTKDASEIVTRAVVYGKAQPVRGESINAAHGTAVDLAEDYLVETSEVVRDPDTGTTYARGVDYRVDDQAGTITTLATGSIQDGQALEVDYQHRSRGVFESDSHDGDPAHEIARTIPAATTDRACEQAALKIVQTADEPRWTADVTVDAAPPDVPLSTAVDLDQLPTRDEALEVWDVADEPGGVSMQLGNRDEVAEVVDDIRSRLEAVARLS